MLYFEIGHLRLAMSVTSNNAMQWVKNKQVKRYEKGQFKEFFVWLAHCFLEILHIPFILPNWVSFSHGILILICTLWNWRRLDILRTAVEKMHTLKEQQCSKVVHNEKKKVNPRRRPTRVPSRPLWLVTSYWHWLYRVHFVKNVIT